MRKKIIRFVVAAAVLSAGVLAPPLFTAKYVQMAECGPVPPGEEMRTPDLVPVLLPVISGWTAYACGDGEVLPSPEIPGEE